MSEFRRFYLQRDEDESGISGTGRVVDGVQFNDGTVVIRWNSNTASTSFYNNMKEMEFLHGHDGKSKVVWIDSILDVIDV